VRRGGHCQLLDSFPGAGPPSRSRGLEHVRIEAAARASVTLRWTICSGWRAHPHLDAVFLLEAAAGTAMSSTAADV